MSEDLMKLDMDILKYLINKQDVINKQGEIISTLAPHKPKVPIKKIYELKQDLKNNFA